MMHILLAISGLVVCSRTCRILGLPTKRSIGGKGNKHWYVSIYFWMNLKMKSVYCKTSAAFVYTASLHAQQQVCMRCKALTILSVSFKLISS